MGPEDLRDGSPLDPVEGELLERLRADDEEAFACLVDRHHAAMVRLARGYVRSPAVAEEVAQDAWLGLLRGLDRFEGRSSLRTWLFRIVVKRTWIRPHARTSWTSTAAGATTGICDARGLTS